MLIILTTILTTIFITTLTTILINIFHHLYYVHENRHHLDLQSIVGIFVFFSRFLRKVKEGGWQLNYTVEKILLIYLYQYYHVIFVIVIIVDILTLSLLLLSLLIQHFLVLLGGS